MLLLLSTILVNSYAMETSTPIEEPLFSNYIQYIAELLLGNVRFRQEESSQLPPEDKSKIISFLLLNDNADSINTVGKTINSLAHINKELNELINNPHFCLQLIKYLAQRFDCSDEVVALALQTKEAINRLAIQKLFEIILCEEQFNKKTCTNFYIQYKDYVDLNFTYKTNEQTDFKYTLLLLCAKKLKTDGIARITWLLSTNAININCADKFGTTALMLCTTNADPKTITLLCNYPGININQKNKAGETALMWMCKRSGTMIFKPENMQALINAGADPEIADDDGDTPLDVVENYENQEAINLIQQAIKKKHHKK